MCTLIAFHRAWDSWPLVIAVNRDEAYDRPSRPPEWIEATPRILAPRDEREGGTWMGANEAGVWVGLTNRHVGDVEADRRSRGLLCLDLLGETTPGAVVERLGDLEETYDPFHLVTGDGRELWRVEYEGGVVDVRETEPGCHVVTNRPGRDSEAEPKVERARELLEARGVWPTAEAEPPSDLETRLTAVLGDHGTRGPDALCLHGSRYGTRSGAVWWIRPDGPGGAPEIGLAFAEGPPCSAPFARVAP